MKAILTIAVEDDLTSIIGQTRTAHEAFKALESEIQADMEIRKNELYHAAATLCQVGDQSIDQYVAKANELMATAVDVDDVGAAQMLLMQFITGLKSDVRSTVGVGS